MTLDLYKARRTAEAYYASPTHAQNVEELRALLRERETTLADLHLALDLEGVLVNTKFPDEFSIDLGERLKRPLAQELVNLLKLYVKKLTIWTASYGGLAEDMIKSGELVLPEGIEIIDRNRYIHRLLSGDTRGVGQLLWAIEQKEKELPPGTSEEIKTHIGSCAVKVARALSVDYLFDDEAEKHRMSCRTLGFPEDAERVIAVSPFSLKDSGDIDNHHEDLGLLEAVRQAVRQSIR